jgi:hypothetical protein
MGTRRFRRYDVDTAELAKACTVLAIALPVRVVLRSFKYRSGRYTGTRGGKHVITLDAMLSPRKANRILWHELTHAAQVERLGGYERWNERWWNEMRHQGLTREQALRAETRRYSQTPLEQEARDNERLHRRGRLVRRRRRSRSALAPLRLPRL